MDIKLDNDQLTSAIHAAVLTALGEDTKTLIVKQVVDYLTTAPSSSYGNKPTSPLLSAINDAARRYATKFVEEQMAADASFKERLNALYVEALEKAFAGDQASKITDRMADALVKALTGEERY